jgi:hypothetical protein
MGSITFVIDESGAKGYSDKREQHEGEFGVVAGILIPEEHLSVVESDLNFIANKYESEGKLHITDLESNDQECLRGEIFDYLLSKHIRWTYEAMYVEGLHNQARIAATMVKTAKENHRSNVNISCNEKRDLLHAEIFTGVFGKGVAFCLDNVSHQFHLNVITDNIDKSILRKFKEGAQQLLNVGKKNTCKVTGFDHDSQSVVTGSVSFEITQGRDVLGDFSGVLYDINVSESVLTLAADVLVNSVHHHLASLQESNPGCALNTKEAIEGHRLAQIVYGVSEVDLDVLQISDTIFRYPSRL